MGWRRVKLLRKDERGVYSGRPPSLAPSAVSCVSSGFRVDGSSAVPATSGEGGDKGAPAGRYIKGLLSPPLDTPEKFQGARRPGGGGTVPAASFPIMPS